MNPQSYAARTNYRPPARWYQRLNRIGILIVALGLAPRDVVTLEVRGRRSGKVRRVPILRTTHKGDDYLVALAGESQWVRNARAAGGAAVVRRRRSRRALLHELAVGERAPIISTYLDVAMARSGEKSASRQAQFYFGLTPSPSIADIESIAAYYPVFRIEYR